MIKKLSMEKSKKINLLLLLLLRTNKEVRVLELNSIRKHREFMLTEYNTPKVLVVVVEDEVKAQVDSIQA